ncbi:MAG: S49 family peptidase, partial [Rikenella sp.]|nr:S49 family peptidase [Rikenella sp.]
IYIQNGVDTVYARFVEVVAQGRSLAADSVDALAGGRVWTGLQAVANGLADATGTLTDAVRIAATHAGLHDGDYAVRQYPEPEPPSFFSMMGSLSATAMAKLTGRDAGPAIGAEALRVRERVMNRGIRVETPCRIEIRH